MAVHYLVDSIVEQTSTRHTEFTIAKLPRSSRSPNGAFHYVRLSSSLSDHSVLTRR